MSWKSILGEALKIAVIAFVVLQLKEQYDAGQFDTPANAVDGTLVGAGTFIVGAAQKLLKRGG
ncbi:MAG TPA: hypothetical protein VKB45_07225 [Gemmatimonadales bacterium]|nr:hypothetical protein [Gemmatimonadales bacterium]